MRVPSIVPSAPAATGLCVIRRMGANVSVFSRSSNGRVSGLPQLGDTRSTRSAPPPLDVVTYNAPSGPSTGERNRPYSDDSAEVCATSPPAPSNVSTRKCEPFKHASTNAPFHEPHCPPVRKVAPEGAIVGEPDAHDGRMASGKRATSVIGTLWSYVPPKPFGSQSPLPPARSSVTSSSRVGPCSTAYTCAVPGRHARPCTLR